MVRDARKRRERLQPCQVRRQLGARHALRGVQLMQLRLRARRGQLRRVGGEQVAQVLMQQSASSEAPCARDSAGTTQLAHSGIQQVKLVKRSPNACVALCLLLCVLL